MVKSAFFFQINLLKKLPK